MNSTSSLKATDLGPSGDWSPRVTRVPSQDWLVEFRTRMGIFNVDKITFTAVGKQASGGDINLDGNVSAADADMLRKYLIGNEQLNSEQAKQADLDVNQVINAIDLTLLKQMLLRQ